LKREALYFRLREGRDRLDLERAQKLLKIKSLDCRAAHLKRTDADAEFGMEDFYKDSYILENVCSLHDSSLG